MTTKLYLCVLAGMLSLAACQQRATSGFMPSHPEPIVRARPVTGATPAVEALPNAEPTATRRNMEPFDDESDFTVALPMPGGASPVLLASHAEPLGEHPQRTRYEAQARALRVKAAAEKAEASGKLSAAPRKLNFAEKAVTKLVTKKLNKKIAKAKRGEATQRIDGNIRIGIVFLAVALILSLLSVGYVYVVIAGVLGAAFLLIGLLNHAAG